MQINIERGLVFLELKALDNSKVDECVTPHNVPQITFTQCYQKSQHQAIVMNAGTRAILPLAPYKRTKYVTGKLLGMVLG